MVRRLSLPPTARFAEPGSVESRLSECLHVSDRELVGTATMLLDPSMCGADGEWQAVFLAHWSPGAEQFASFRDLMEEQRRRSIADAPPEGLTRPGPSALHVLWNIVRGRQPDA